MGNRPFAVGVADDGTWISQTRIYDSGSVSIEVTATATWANTTATSSATTQVQASLASPIPALVVTAPPDGSEVRLGEAGADVQLKATMADANAFGGHIVTVQLEDGHAVTLAAVPGSTTEFIGTVHFPPMPLGPRTFTFTGACGAAAEYRHVVSVHCVCVEAGPPHVTVTHPRVAGGEVAAEASANDPTSFTVSISGTASDLQSGMAGGLASVSVALHAQDTRMTARPARPGDFTSWTVDALPLPKPGAPLLAGAVPLGTFPLMVWATDNAGTSMPSPLAWSFEAIKAWVPKNGG